MEISIIQSDQSRVQGSKDKHQGWNKEFTDWKSMGAFPQGRQRQFVQKQKDVKQDGSEEREEGIGHETEQVGSDQVIMGS